MFEKIMNFVQENSYTVTNPCNTYEFIQMISCKKLEDFLREFLHEDETEDRFFW